MERNTMNETPDYIIEVWGEPGHWYAVAKSVTGDVNNSGKGCETAIDAASGALWHLVPDEEA
jgi:hypothetical protein